MIEMTFCDSIGDFSPYLWNSVIFKKIFFKDFFLIKAHILIAYMYGFKNRNASSAVLFPHG